ncbi:enoyl-CoA hydratase/isomerase family protein [Mycolicibacterium hassiacum DSM 44199]|uniref:Enoyl-CoA hydratase/isomerase family protein n=1 Tax=Mycolicibacterium hassiacum (strain DSM 44199 / CIP 105218 / JCM 12690 / 3849) TaxID=1122247 RepID=K5BD19_MYCHD|nr:enoyl-CoA hydratase-related protein [Mycolicibacterium hassiacum]EKF21201.1 enoyl-CoA hydratase/isomerase family protein [Mycolicibacterium hassiacum DSM 44199]MBX5487444.1 enoyl-CoA hydratase/isomerase family protein [Mycolicibacterium hassiacum]MDA4085030.1 enoyl-CoA hydratase [Mycolicibacterium hassiacum DSM 44199]PZN20681.1 MAG: enoyl-CoA hydratase [Mycolicibacterium hassiacum]VCT89055.1 1,2-epoxyphenylacetyl-CoA isomerase [Mycolicibacterium hassiacum DSM 44199]
MADEQPGIEVVTDDDGVRRITIDRADVGNSLSPLARDALADAFLSADRDPAVRAVLLTAAGSRHFCTGAGLSADSRPAERRPGDIARLLQQGWQRLIGAILDCAKPVVAAVNGTAAGAGASLVLASDLVVMSETARLIEPFVARGILPDSGAVFLLTRIVGLRRATELLMLGEPVDAARCEQLGLVNRVVAAEAVYPTALELARRLAAGPTVMLSLTKRLLAVSSESGRDRAFTEEAWAQEIVSTSHDLQEGLRAFAERREPRFRGC